MAADNATSPRRILDPVERVSEVVFGLIMVLTFTCSFSVAGAGRQDVSRMLLAALGCNLAWGIIDGLFYLMGCLSDRGHNLLILRQVQGATNPIEADRVIAEALPPAVSAAISPAGLEEIRRKLQGLPEPEGYARLKREDWLGAAAVFVLVFFSTLPVAVPFIFLQNARLALRVSNGVAVAMLFASGYVFGRYSGRRAWRDGVIMVLLGVAMVGVTIAFDG